MVFRLFLDSDVILSDDLKSQLTLMLEQPMIAYMKACGEQFVAYSKALNAGSFASMTNSLRSVLSKCTLGIAHPIDSLDLLHVNTVVYKSDNCLSKLQKSTSGFKSLVSRL
jgi:hypothetical protein